MTYGIQRKDSRRFFGGFDRAGVAIWTERESAWRTDCRHKAEAQAILLFNADPATQRKPVNL